MILALRVILIMSLELYERAQDLKSIAVARATGNAADASDYARLRQELITDQRTKTLVPAFIKRNRTLEEFWFFIKSTAPTYQERRDYLQTEFSTLLDILELSSSTPSDAITSNIFTKIDSAHISEAWQKALERRIEDPDGAITMARTLMEATCKHILDEAGESYEEGLELPKLYKKAASTLNLAPSQHSEEVLRQIAQGCATAVEGLGSMRNRLGDAHGRGKKGVKPLPLHAELAVNLSGTLASFLLGTSELRKKAASSALPTA